MNVVCGHLFSGPIKIEEACAAWRGYCRETMCSLCKDILVQFAIEHTEARCPLAGGSYCSHCAIFGHVTAECKSRPSSRYTKPVYLEQLIGPMELIEFGIRTKTPLLSAAFAEDDLPQEIRVKNSDPIISAYLISKGIKPGKKSALRAQLDTYAKTEKMRVVYEP